MSLMNWQDFYIEDLLATLLLEYNENTFIVDIKTKESLPNYFKDIDILQKRIEYYCDRFFPRLLNDVGFNYEQNIKEAKMTITFDFQNKVFRSDDVVCIDFVATTILIDELDKIHSKDYKSTVFLSLKTIDEIKERYFNEYKNPLQLSQKD